MAKTSRSREHYRDHHDWHSQDYVSKWAEGQDPKEKERQEQFRLLAKTVPYDKQLPIKILDVGIWRPDAVSPQAISKRYGGLSRRIRGDGQAGA